MKNLILIIGVLTVLMTSSCADSKDFIINGETVTVEPYGWANHESLKNDSVIYEVSIGNTVCSVIFCQTLIVPVLLTGWEIMEPVALKNTEVKGDTSVMVIQ